MLGSTKHPCSLHQEFVLFLCYAIIKYSAISILLNYVLRWARISKMSSSPACPSSSILPSLSAFLHCYITLFSRSKVRILPRSKICFAFLFCVLHKYNFFSIPKSLSLFVKSVIGKFRAAFLADKEMSLCEKLIWDRSQRFSPDMESVEW